jgi:hypothetical protein
LGDFSLADVGVGVDNPMLEVDVEILDCEDEKERKLGVKDDERRLGSIDSSRLSSKSWKSIFTLGV